MDGTNLLETERDNGLYKSFGSLSGFFGYGGLEDDEEEELK